MLWQLCQKSSNTTLDVWFSAPGRDSLLFRENLHQDFPPEPNSWRLDGFVLPTSLRIQQVETAVHLLLCSSTGNRSKQQQQWLQCFSYIKDLARFRKKGWKIQAEQRWLCVRTQYPKHVKMKTPVRDFLSTDPSHHFTQLWTLTDQNTALHQVLKWRMRLWDFSVNFISK